MNKTSKLLAAAIAGIVGATFAASPLEAKGRSKDDAKAEKKMDKDTKGQNACNGGAACGGKGNCAGKNECKGKGGCKTDKHSCKGMNECKGQGGCKA